MPIRSVTVYVLGDGTGLTRTLNRATVDIDRFAANAEKSGGRIGTLLGSSVTKGFAGAAVGLAAGLGVAAAAAVPFEAAMHNVATISDDVRTHFAGTSQAVLDLSKTVPQAATTLAKGLYEIVSSNFAGADAFHVLEVSAKAASAGLTDTDTSARAITAALNAYGLSAASAGDVSDILFQTVNKGVVTFHDLAQNLGDFVGIAAAAKVPLQDVAAAYAGITLAGIQAPEAATSVNQLLTKLIKPTEELKAAYKTLGYESGAAALQQKGLKGVIEDIGRVTGGSSEQLVRMFNDVRAARGVLALLSAGGKNYQAAVDGITDASTRAGATQRAFNEQMKSTQARLQLFANQAEAVGIAVGLKVLPAINGFLSAAREAGADAVPYLEAALHRVAPLFQQLWAIIGNVATIIGELARDAAPLAGVLAKIAAAAVIGPLTLFLKVLQSITGFLAEHKGVVEAVAAVYAATLVPSLTAVTVAFNRLVLTPIVLGLAGLASGAGGAAQSLKQLATSAGLANAAISAGLAAAIFAVVRGTQQWNDAQAEAKDNADGIRKSFDAYNADKATAQLAQLRAEMEHSAKVGEQYQGIWGQFKAGFSEVAGDGSVGKVAAQGEEAAKAYAELSAKLANTQSNLTAVARDTGLTAGALGELAKKANIDLSHPFDSSADARKRLIGYVHDLRNADDVTAASIANNANLDVDSMKQLEDAIQGVVKAATTAFEKDTDVLGKFDPAGEAKKLDDAQKAVNRTRSGSTSARTSQLRDEQRIARDQQAIRDAEQRAMANQSRSYRSHLSDEQSIARARRKLADDQALIAAKAQGTSTGGGTGSAAGDKLSAAQAAANKTLKQRYDDAILLARNFVRDVNQAIQRGLDPNVVAKLMAQGPEKAEPILQRLLADSSGSTIQMVNNAEKEIGQLSGFVAEQARIAAIAMNAPTDQYTKDLKSAMAIATLEAAAGGRATMEALVKSLHLPRRTIRRIAAEFGIDISSAIQDEVNQHPVQVPLVAGASDPNATGKRIIASLGKPRAEGGAIDWGPPGRDTVPAMVTRGEWVQPRAAVDYYGAAFMESVRTRTLPKFWDGGQVGGGAVLNVAGPRVVAVPVPVTTSSRTDNSTNYNIGAVTVRDTRELAARYPGRSYSPTRGIR